MLKYIATPVFIILAILTYRDAIYVCIIPGPLSFIGSMWFMYLVMAVVHADGWVRLLHGAMRSS